MLWPHLNGLMWPRHKQSQFCDIIKEIRQEITNVILQLIQNYTREHKKDQSESFIFCLIFWWFLKGEGGGLLDILISYSKSSITKSFVKTKFFKFYLLIVSMYLNSVCWSKTQIHHSKLKLKEHKSQLTNKSSKSIWEVKLYMY